MSRDARDIICDISDMLDIVEGEFINLIEDRDDLQEKLKDLEEQEKEFPKAYDLGFEEGFAKGEQSMQEKMNKLCEFWNNNNTATLIALFDGMILSQIFEDIETAYNKIVEYEKKEKEIKVGDEVVDCDGTKFIVRFLNDSYADVLAYNGVSVECDYADISKTGKHYPIDEMLKELKQ